MIAREEVITKAQDPDDHPGQSSRNSKLAQARERRRGRRHELILWPTKFQIHCCRWSKSSGLIDDLQYEEVVRGAQAQRQARLPDSAGFRHHGPGLPSCRSWPITWGPRWSTLRDADMPAGAAQDDSRPTRRGCISACRSRCTAPRCRSRLTTRSIPARSTNWGSSSSKDIQLVVGRSGGDREAIDEVLRRQDDQRERCPRSSRNWARTRKSPRKSPRWPTTDDADADGGPGQRSADRPVREPGPAPGGAGPRQRHSLRAVRNRVQASATAWTARSTKCRRRPSTWPCR